MGVLSLMSRRRSAETDDYEPDVNRRCRRHPFEVGSHNCHYCGDDFCEECFVYPLGPRRPGLCIPCAMAKAGVSVRTR